MKEKGITNDDEKAELMQMRLRHQHRENLCESVDSIERLINHKV